MNVGVCYAEADRQLWLRLEVPDGSTIQQAIELSGVLIRYPHIDLTTQKVGIFGKLAKADTVLRDRDRIEIYRPLLADPKEVRRKRAEEGRAMKKGGGDV